MSEASIPVSKIIEAAQHARKLTGDGIVAIVFIDPLGFRIEVDHRKGANQRKIVSFTEVELTKFAVLVAVLDDMVGQVRKLAEQKT